MNDVCTHLDQVLITGTPSSVEGCEDCLCIGVKRLRLCICLTCGHVGCSDDSPNRHARAHVQAAPNPIVRSLEPGQDWNWCYIDQVGFRVDEIHGNTHILPSPILQ